MDTNETSPQKNELISKQSQEISTLNTEVEELRKEVKQLREDLELINVFQKKPVVSTELVQTVGGLIIAALVIIGIFF
ncbi:hypothetical protein ABZ756_13910 [Mammaliicoccus sciuri]|uniref:Uncharacterized protein n=2 Tax=Sporosarcina newyorkensis TaxID=759851 RepID=A0A1T4YTY0_9BACL|nr:MULTISPECIES: spectrin repeat,Rudiment single hybrid domain protein [Sporosarcina]EGQ25999.1 spectrin repeat,Rudiment single hybrid domain protein [Sporosarcina newyorkensis 2681]MBY0223545.1 hypothetical protein [Sporosarcina aquimarina]SKB05048.1 hypothetical protein SAMN04244570_3537 [Sporosarcina newyorkensis]